VATNFPASLDALTNPISSDTLESPDHAGQHADANDAIEALEAKVGINGSAVATSLDYKVGLKSNTASPTFTGTVVLPATSASGAISPSVTNTYDLGTASLRWRNIYTQDLHLSNGFGDYTVIEGEENLYLVNNKTNKSFKFALIEVDRTEVPKASDI
tara:strand:- start:7446 stop:7919 length:474 start_codon:yes stop_codon:yes gene_type:complete